MSSASGKGDPTSSSASSFDSKRLKEILKVVDPSVKDLFNNNCFNVQALSSVIKSICVIGLTGHGKSHTCNSLSKSEEFKVSADTISETDKVSGVVTRWRKQPKGEPCMILDTPGMGDSKGRDTSHIANMVVDLKTIGYVHTFIIAINSEELRFSDHLQSTIKLFSQMFGIDFFKNVLVCFTKFSNCKKTNNLRAAGKKITREKLI